MNNPLASFLEDVEPANTPEFEWPENCPPPGIYENIPDAEYRSWNAISQSTLKVASEATWAHVRATLDGKIERKSDALAFGRALHTWLLEPHLFEDTYQVALPCAAEIKSGDRKGEECGCAGRYFNSLDEVWLCGKHAPKGFEEPENVVTEADLERIKGMEASLATKPMVEMLRRNGANEVCVVVSWDGVPFKCRLDRLCLDFPDGPVIADVKKVPLFAANEKKFGYDIDKYRYDVQGAAYCKAVEQFTNERARFLWLVIEDGGTYECHPFQMSEKRRNDGAMKLDVLWHGYLHCLATGVWPSYTQGLEATQI